MANLDFGRLFVPPKAKPKVLPKLVTKQYVFDEALASKYYAKCFGLSATRTRIQKFRYDYLWLCCSELKSVDVVDAGLYSETHGMHLLPIQHDIQP